MALRDDDYLALQVEALFRFNADGRIVVTNEPTPQDAPRFFLGRTHEGSLWHIHANLPAATAARLASLVATMPITADLRVNPSHLAAILAALGTDSDHAETFAGPAYHFPDPLPTADQPRGSLPRRLTPVDIPLLARMGTGWDAATLADEFSGWEPMFALSEDGEIASLAFSPRSTIRAAEAGVTTLPAHRGKGYAPAVVAAWAHAVHAEGRIPLYSTSWENAASRAVARTLGLMQYGSDLSVW